jgi:hypothetical protein
VNIAFQCSRPCHQMRNDCSKSVTTVLTVGQLFDCCLTVTTNNQGGVFPLIM